MVFLVVPFIGVLAIVTTTQQAGAHCPELTLATGVAEAGGLSGLYRWDGGFSNERPVYRQVDGWQCTCQQGHFFPTLSCVVCVCACLPQFFNL